MALTSSTFVAATRNAAPDLFTLQRPPSDSARLPVCHSGWYMTMTVESGALMQVAASELSEVVIMQ